MAHRTRAGYFCQLLFREEISAGSSRQCISGTNSGYLCSAALSNEKKQAWTVDYIQVNAIWQLWRRFQIRRHTREIYSQQSK